MFYSAGVHPTYRIEPCKSALNRVRGMPFSWSLNPYMGCVHRCSFCYVRAFELRADRPADGRYGSSIRVKLNVAEVLARELARPSWRGETVAIGAATDPYQPAEGRFRLTRGCLEALAAAANPFDLITRGPLIVRDLDVLAAAARTSRQARVRRKRPSAGWYGSVAAPIAMLSACHAGRASSRRSTSAMFDLTRIEVP